MLTWILENIGTILIAIIVAAFIVFLLIKMRKDKKKGKTSCGGGCSGCPMAGKCHSNL